MATLYRKYRPRTFAELVGQDSVREALQQAILRQRLAHAYLLYGPRGTGKTTSARLLAARVNCTAAQDAEPCRTCASCQAAAAGNHPDIIEIDAASNRGIDDVRVLREAAKFVPSLGQYKVYIIDEVHMLTNEAASALLKTLEEPSPHVLFILATTELHKVLPTIASRCQVYRFRRAQPAEMRERLRHILKGEKRTLGDDVLTFVIDRADGCCRDAESLLGQLLTWQAGEISLEQATAFLGLPPARLLDSFVRALVAGESAPAIAAVDEAAAGGGDPEQFLKESIRLVRDRALGIATGAPDEPAGLEVRAPQILRALLQALQDLAYVPEPMISVHLAILTVCHMKGEAKPVASAPAQTKEAAVPLTEIKQAWPGFIAAVKEKNPVAATFLRALEPAEVVGEELHIKAHYSLHRTFFEKPANKQLLVETLSGILKRDIAVRFSLVESGGAQPSLAEQRKAQEKKFAETGKEVV